MSPVSRGRKPKKAKKGKKPPARVTSSGWAKAAKREFGGLSLAAPGASREEFFGSLDRRPRWWEPSFERLIAASDGLLAAQGPRVLEQATAELIGAELHRAVRDEHTGLHLDAWATGLIGRSVDWMADATGRGDDAWQGPWWLLRGLAAIGPYGRGGLWAGGWIGWRMPRAGAMMPGKAHGGCCAVWPPSGRTGSVLSPGSRRRRRRVRCRVTFWPRSRPG